ncbi:MAG: beta-N-acetylhexosaminidase [Gammaproteobacteria bacterium]|nr:beta-N-acetylhexosaminidase [Gammaproteobacteria bacterium]
MEKLIIWDLMGYQLTTLEKKRLSHPLTAGIILFTRNYQNTLQITKLCQEIKEINPNILICIDQEGGKVQRLKGDTFTELPSFQSIGKVYEQNEIAGLQLAYASGYLIGRELGEVGIDFSFTPVVDLNYQKSEIIGSRSFHKSPHIVTRLCFALTTGLQQAGISHCLKHFPGHGFVTQDSHTDLPIDPRELEEILTHDILPYTSVLGGWDSLMTAHIIYPKVDKLAVCYSSMWLQTILRRQLRIDSCIFSDDLSMYAARVVDYKELTYFQACQMSIAAGCDILLICNQPHILDSLLEQLTRLEVQTDQSARLHRFHRLFAHKKPTNPLASDARYQISKEILKTIAPADGATGRGAPTIHPQRF